MLLPYRAAHLNTCVDLFIAAFTAPPLSYDFLTPENTRRYLRDLTQVPGFEGYLYEVDAIPAAFCFGAIDDYFHPPSYEVKELAVAPAFHNRGIGSKVMAALEALQQKKGVTAITLNTSRTIPAYYFYKKLGYTTNADNVTLTKSLTD